jgi:hypothetical protein
MNRQQQSEIITMRERLSTFLAEDSGDRLWGHITRSLEDPLQPRNSSGRIRVNPLLLILASVVVLSVGIFLFFSYGQP